MKLQDGWWRSSLGAALAATLTAAMWWLPQDAVRCYLGPELNSDTCPGLQHTFGFVQEQAAPILDVLEDERGLVGGLTRGAT